MSPIWEPKVQIQTPQIFCDIVVIPFFGKKLRICDTFSHCDREVSSWGWEDIDRHALRRRIRRSKEIVDITPQVKKFPSDLPP